jgi:hypothetical protein
VRLDDVLSRNHLPPIGLKDFEEYLLYVEHAPENLYFILWLKEYTTRYQSWVQRAKASLVNQKDSNSLGIRRPKFRNPPTPDPSLALFYARAKQTFFTPNAEYELNIPSDILAPFHCPPHSSVSNSRNSAPAVPWHSQIAHPDPAVFIEVAIETRNMLSESLARFVRAAYTNVGSGRATCGIVAGSFFTLAGGVLPLVVTTGRWNVGPHGRLMRLAAFPGLWLGLTILIASLQGICIMVYVFGDLRQLRKFELARPIISRPILPIPISAPVAPRGPLNSGPSIPISHDLLVEKDPQEKLPTSPVAINSVSSFAVHSPLSSQRSGALSVTSCVTSCESGETDDGPSEDGLEIDVSPAFFDEDPAPEGPATASCLHRPEYRPPPSSVTFVAAVHPRPRLPTLSTGNGYVEPGPSSQNAEIAPKTEPEYGPTAVFIPNDITGDSTTTTQRSRNGVESCFDFDLLPAARQSITIRRSNGHLHGDAMATSPDRTDAPLSKPPDGSNQSASGGRAQYKCNKRIYPFSQSSDSGTSIQIPYSITPTPPPSPERSRPTSSFALLIPSFTAGVPAFAAPLTQVRSCVVKRAQWEVVIRAGAVAFLGASTIAGVIIGVVP